jgi:hypothetical protein
LRTAELENSVDAGDPRGESSLGRRAGRHHDQLAHAGDHGRDRGHQHRGRIARGATRHVETDASERGVAKLEVDAVEIERDVGIALLVVERADSLRGELEGRPDVGADLGGQGFPACRVDLVASAVGLAPVELARVLLDGLVAASANVVEDRGDLRIDVAGHPGRPIEKGGSLDAPRAQQLQHRRQATTRCLDRATAVDLLELLGRSCE